MADTKANTYPKIAIVAGEASGDLHGARVAEALRCLYPDVFLFGAGGAAMTAAGVELAVHSDDLSVMGFSAVITKLPAIFKAMGRLKRLLRAYRPELVILIDFPDFNLRLASTAKKLRFFTTSAPRYGPGVPGALKK